MVSDPINVFDSAPDADGAAALVVTATPARVHIAASTMATDALAVHDRPDLLTFEAARLSAARAYEMAGISPDDVDLFELHDAFTVLAARRASIRWRRSFSNCAARPGRIRSGMPVGGWHNALGARGRRRSHIFSR